MQNFTVMSHASSSHVDNYADAVDISLILPDMHMWPDPQGLCDNRFEFLHFWDFVQQPFSKLMALNHLEHVETMRKEEREHAFGTAGRHLVRLLNKVKDANKRGFRVQVTQLGDLLKCGLQLQP
jgi:hypothetical protein